jgi:rhamnogalacturonyl hydrolase YesR
MTDVHIPQALDRLRAYVEREGYKGYDPYDTLNAWLPFRWMGKWGPVLAIQVQKRNPINIRPLLGIRKDYNPKAMGLLLYAYSLRYEQDRSELTRARAQWLFNWLMEHPSEGYSGPCWGYNFGWASPVKYLPTYTPSIVVTGFVGQGLFAYYQATGDERALEALKGACAFILNDLPHTELDDGICFSYTPVMQDICYNASMLGAELFARMYAVTGDAELRSLAHRAVGFVVAQQHEDGRWNYSLDPDTGQERTQIDFHQGFVLDSLHAYIHYAEDDDPALAEALRRGAAFYRREQFTDEGRSLWRIPREWPVEIHNQAQGILTFTRLAHLDPAYLPFAETIARWTIEHMQGGDGHFYYRIGKYHTNKISYMRWAQAWMMLALTHLDAVLQAQPAAETLPNPTP